MLKSVVVAFCMYVTLVLSQEHQCGPSLLIGPSGWFASPKTFTDIPQRATCKWEIHVKEGRSIRIQFKDIQTDGINNGRSYIRVFDAGDESTMKYFSPYTMMRTDNRNPTFFSKSNVVIVEFLSDGQTKSIGFNATYEAVNNAEFCDKSKLSLDGSIDVDATKCQHEGMRNHFKSCQVTCSQRYTMKSNGNVMCENGMFLPQKPCVLVDLEVKLCVLTNMKYCIYTLAEIENYSSKDMNFDEDEMFDEGSDTAADSGVFHELQNVVAPSTSQAEETGIVLETRGTNVFQSVCSGRLGLRSLCSKNSEGNFAFNCNEYRRNKNLSWEIAMKLKERCLFCRFHGCTKKIPYI